MAKTTVTYSCGHEGEIVLSGPRRERERKIDWAESSGLCRDCYIAERRQKEEAAGPKVIAQVIEAYDPAAAAESYRAKAIRERIQLDACDEIPEPERNSHWAQTRKRAAARVQEAEDLADSAARRPARRRGIELIVINSYPVKDALKARGYRYDAAAIAGTPGWTKTFEEAELREELAWIGEQGWELDLREMPSAGLMLDAIAQGRPELLDGCQPRDTVADAEAAREAAREDRARRRAAAAAAKAEQQEIEAKAATFQAGDRPDTIRLVPAEERTEARPYDLRIGGCDGRIAWGWATDDGWIITAIESHGVIHELPPASPEGDRIASQARTMHEATQ